MINNERPVTVPTEQAAAYEAVENGSSGFKPQGSVVPDSNSNASQSDSQNSGATGYSGISTGAESELPQTNENIQAENASFKAVIRDNLESGMPVNYFDFINAGFKTAYIDKNRVINPKHTNDFTESFKRIKCALTTIKVIPARVLIIAGYIVRDRAGNELTLSTPNLDDYNCIIDGQHKADALALWMMNEETKDIPVDAKIELASIPQGVSIIAYIGEFNLVCEKWGHRDTKSLAGLVFKDEGATILSRINECIEQDRMSARAAWKIYKLTDGYTKVKYEDALFSGNLSSELRGTEAEIERGDRICRAIRVGCRNEQKMKRNSAIIDAVIEAYNAAPDTEKVETMNLLVLFVTTLSDQVLQSAIKESTVVKKTDIITKAWREFQKEIKKSGKREGYELLASKVKQEYDTPCVKVDSRRKTASDIDKIISVLA